MIRLLVDCVAFQKQASVRELWHPIIAWLAKLPSLEVFLLDRGGVPMIGETAALPFPAHLGQLGAADSLLIQRFCDHLSVDVFTSTGSTTPVATPGVLFVPSSEVLLSSDPEDRASLSYAQRYLCSSGKLLASLLADYPEVPPSCAVVCSEDPRTISIEIENAARVLSADARSGSYESFFEDWKRIREIQAAVDWRLIPPGQTQMALAPPIGGS
jgi:hypothetical protein